MGLLDEVFFSPLKIPLIRIGYISFLYYLDAAWHTVSILLG